jgi:uncharacterized protein (TIGR02246 family)
MSRIPFSQPHLTMVALAISSLLLPIQEAMAAEANATREAIQVLERKYDAAYNSGDAAALASLYSDDAQIFAPDHEVIKGRHAIQEFWKGLIAASTAKNESTPIQIEDHGEVAIETGTWVGRNPDGDIAEQGKYMVVWKRDGARWKIHRETWNSVRPASVNAADPELRRTQQEYDRAWLRQDPALFERLLSKDFMQVDPQGKVLTKSEVIANAKSGEVKFEVGQSDEVKVRIYGDTAIVSGKWTEESTNKGQTTEAVMQNIVVFARIDNQWKVVSDQVTIIDSQKQ